MGGFDPASPTVRTADHSQLVISGPAAAGKVLTGTGPGAASWAAGGGGPQGTTRAFAWQATQQLNAGGSQARPAGGWAFTDVIPGGPVLTTSGHTLPTTAEDPTYGWSLDNYVGMTVAAAGWYDLRPFYELKFAAGAAPEWATLDFYYDGCPSDESMYPLWQVALPPSNPWQHFGSPGSYGPILLAAGAEITMTAKWPDASSMIGAQFGLDVTAL